MLTAAMIVVEEVTTRGSRYELAARMLETETGRTLRTVDGTYGSLDELAGGLTDFGNKLSGAGASNAPTDMV